jgi:hypothetical protein
VNWLKPRQDLIRRVAQLEQTVSEMAASMELRVAQSIGQRMFIPQLDTPSLLEREQFMPYSTCSAADFLHSRYAEICKLLNMHPVFHRKLWEWVFIIHKLQEAGVLAEGKRGVVFGVGQEKLPALFASMGATIVATDAPLDIGTSAGWTDTKEHSNSLEQLKFPDIVSEAVFNGRVTHRSCDMTAIAADLTGFDFTWSSCCFEHLGSLEAGIEFVINSVAKTLKVGGVACHTTEFNLSSEHDTLVDGPTVIYRRKDIINLVDRLRARGHEVESFAMAPDAHYLDYHVDVPPYTHNPHIKLKLQQYVTTSVGIVVRRG